MAAATVFPHLDAECAETSTKILLHRRRVPPGGRSPARRLSTSATIAELHSGLSAQVCQRWPIGIRSAMASVPGLYARTLAVLL